MDEWSTVTLEGATHLEIRFDPRTQTESGCDWLRFARTAGSADWLSPPLSGGGDNWPGVGARAPLEVDGDTISFQFHSDGSINYWG